MRTEHYGAVASQDSRERASACACKVDIKNAAKMQILMILRRKMSTYSEGAGGGISLFIASQLRLRSTTPWSALTKHLNSEDLTVSVAVSGTLSGAAGTVQILTASAVQSTLLKFDRADDRQYGSESPTC